MFIYEHKEWVVENEGGKWVSYLTLFILNCLFQDVYLLSQEESLNEISNDSDKSLNPLHSNITFIDQSPDDHQTIIDNTNTAKTLPRLGKNGRVFRKMFASPEDSHLSGSSLSQASGNSFRSLEHRRNHFKLRNTSTESDSFNRKSPKEDRYLFAKGIKRSTAFHTAELLQEQVKFLSGFVLFFIIFNTVEC